MPASPTASGTDSKGALGAWPLLVLLAISLYVVVFPMPCDDHWWHIVTGREVLASGQIPDRDPFSFTFAGTPWVNWEWLAGVVLAGAWQLAGPIGMVLLRFLALGGTLAVALWHRSRRGAEGHPLAVLGASLLALLVLQSRTADRPHTLAFPLLALADALATRQLVRGGWASASALVGLFLLWVNLHPSWMLGLAWILTRAAAHLWSSRSRGRLGPELRRLLPAHLLLLLTPLATPNADRFFLAVLEIFAERVSPEWGSFFEYIGWGQFPLWAFALLVVLWLPGAIRRPHLEGAFLLLVAGLAFLHVRFAPLFALLVLPRLALPARLPLRPRAERLAAALLLTIGLAFGQLVMRGLGNGLGIGVDPLRNPVSAADFLEAAGLGGSVYATSKEAHGYLLFRLWPQVRIYIDGRVPQVYPPEFLSRYVQTGDPAVLDGELDRWRVQHVVLVQGLGTRINRNVVALLHERADFALLYFDETGAVWSRRDALPLDCASCRPFVALDPWRLAASGPEQTLARFGSQRVRAELAHLARLAPGTRLTRQLQERFAEALP